MREEGIKVAEPISIYLETQQEEKTFHTRSQMTETVSNSIKASPSLEEGNPEYTSFDRSRKPAVRNGISKQKC